MGVIGPGLSLMGSCKAEIVPVRCLVNTKGPHKVVLEKHFPGPILILSQS